MKYLSFFVAVLVALVMLCQPFAAAHAQANCTSIHIGAQLASSDLLMDQINKKAVQATRLLKKIENTRALNKFISEVLKDSNKAYIQAWGDMFSSIPATVFACDKPCEGARTVESSKVRVLMGVDAQHALVEKILRKIRTRTDQSSSLRSARRIRIQSRKIVDGINDLFAQIPEKSFVAACS